MVRLITRAASLVPVVLLHGAQATKEPSSPSSRQAVALPANAYAQVEAPKVAKVKAPSLVSAGTAGATPGPTPSQASTATAADEGPSPSAVRCGSHAATGRLVGTSTERSSSSRPSPVACAPRAPRLAAVASCPGRTTQAVAPEPLVIAFSMPGPAVAFIVATRSPFVGTGHGQPPNSARHTTVG